MQYLQSFSRPPEEVGLLETRMRKLPFEPLDFFNNLTRGHDETVIRRLDSSNEAITRD